MVRSFISTLELGASVIFTIGIALKRVEDQIKKNTQVLERISAEGLRLPDQMKPAAAGSCCGLAELRPYLDTTLSLLEQQLIALRKPQPVLVQEGSSGSATTEATPERDNLSAFEGLPIVGQAITYGRAALLPTQISAQFQKIIRDITISAGLPKDEKSSAQGASVKADGVKISLTEQDVIAAVKKITTDTGMERNQAAMLIKQLYGTGMGLDKALEYAPVAATFSVGQDAAIGDTTRLISELLSHPKIAGPDELKRALEIIVSQRKGSGEGAAAPLADAQHQQLDATFEKPQVEGATSILDADMEARRDTSERRLSEASDGVDNALLSLGDSVRPLSDWVAGVVEEKANAFAQAPDAVKWLTVGVAALGTTLLALKGGTVVRSLLDKVRHRFKGSPIPEEAVQGSPETSAGPTSAFAFNDPLNVFVVNASDIGCCTGLQERKRIRPVRDRQNKAHSQASKVPPSGKRRRSGVGFAPASAGAVSAQPSKQAASVGKVGSLINRFRRPAVQEAGDRVISTALTAGTAEQKAEGYGAAAGGLLGSVIGGVVGSVIPVVGTSIGVMLGGMAGDAIGGWLGKRLVTPSSEQPLADKPTDNALAAARPGDLVRSLASAAPESQALPMLLKANPELVTAPAVNQQFTFTPNMPITVQGSVSDPTQLAQNLQAMVRRELEELMRMATSRQLSDVPHVYV
ncbi:hypothetical protein [Pseudomonas sp. NUPR-001]|uniref:hypothetical protein n=1 Tax=Pseudomonas sp. NUPR-001 TaxID=3416058 RepID=UPI003F943C5F